MLISNILTSDSIIYCSLDLFTGIHFSFRYNKTMLTCALCFSLFVVAISFHFLALGSKRFLVPDVDRPTDLMSNFSTSLMYVGMLVSSVYVPQLQATCDAMMAHMGRERKIASHGTERLCGNQEREQNDDNRRRTTPFHIQW